jgi:hypothetical protein
LPRCATKRPFKLSLWVTICTCFGFYLEFCGLYCGFCRFLERLRDSSDCLAAKGGRSSPKSIFPALGNSLSAN